MEVLNLSRLLSLVDDMPSYRALLSILKDKEAPAYVNIIEAARPYLISSLFAKSNRPVAVITSHADTSRKLYEQINSWTHSNHIKLLPEPDTLPYERLISDSPSNLDRLLVLSALVNFEKDLAPQLIVIPATAFIRKTASYQAFASTFHTIREGMTTEPLALMKRWQSIGYTAETTVEIPGTMTKRGGIIDVFPPTSELPVRLEFFGNTVESIRFYDPATQLSVRKADTITIGAATELLTDASDEISKDFDLSNCSIETRDRFTRELSGLCKGLKTTGSEFYAPLFNNDNLLSYFPENTLVIIDEPLSVQRIIEDFDEKAAELRDSKQQQGELPLNYPTSYFKWEELKPLLDKKYPLSLTELGFTDDDSAHHLGFTPVSNYGGQLKPFVNKIKQLRSENKRIIIVTQQAERLSEIFGEEDIIAPVLSEIKKIPLPGSLTLIQGLMDSGWNNHDTYLFTDSEIFGFTKQQRLQKKRPVARHKFFSEISADDYIVHIEHGIGKFVGFTTMKSGGSDREFMILQYALGDKLYVPTDQIDRITRYVGSGEQSPSLSRLGTQEWTNTKQKVKEAVEEVAEDLLDLYASRGVVKGHAYSKDTIWQRELEASFPYMETPDQNTAQHDIKEDMENIKPMDRLICGDVGYGKTEVAIRAAFKAVMDGKQVAVLVPTTILTQQHFNTFTERMKAFPIKIESLSRFRTAREQTDIIRGLKDGSVDICIGTHRLTQKDIQFKNLGLLIIDEEQRFGVAHKEHLKKMRKEVDVLTLSATPIPRTLHMSLVGVRDLSTMETSPEDRLPIKTYVAEYDERLVREAVLRELERDGQVFFVHNRVRSIDIVANRLRDLIPEAKVAVAHGQLPEGELEKVTMEFMLGESNLLVCSTIIESGLDIPNVNTIIINQADRFGLTQLYQLRGRVGRGATLAYAYFLFDKGKNLTSIAERRLKTIYEATELGAGFNIALKDLEIRGAGTLLGVKQSGQISAVGFNLYNQMLSAAVEKLKQQKNGARENKTVKKLPAPTVYLPLPALIPEDYVSDIDTRLEIYQRMGIISDTQQISTLAEEFKDRFGIPPKEVENLLYMLKLKIIAQNKGIESISAVDKEIVIQLFTGMRLDKHKLSIFDREGIKIGTGQIRMSLRQPGKGWQRVLEEIVERVG